MADGDKDMAMLLGIMREQGGKDNPLTIELAEMTSPTPCMLGDLPLDEEDLLFNETLLKPVLSELDFTIQNNGGTSHSHNWVDKSKYFKPLKAGDLVAVMKVQDQDMYVVLCKVVSA